MVTTVDFPVAKSLRMLNGPISYYKIYNSPISQLGMPVCNVEFFLLAPELSFVKLTFSYGPKIIVRVVLVFFISQPFKNANTSLELYSSGLLSISLN